MINLKRTEPGTLVRVDSPYEDYVLIAEFRGIADRRALCSDGKERRFFPTAWIHEMVDPNYKIGDKIPKR